MTTGRHVTAPPESRPGQLPMLDTLRAVGAIAVLTTHVGFWSGSYTRDGTWGALVARLDVGVAIFFVLSGFLLSRAWLSAAADGRPAPRTGRYLWRRALRIVPMYVVAVVLALGLIDANARLGLRDWLVSLAMLNTFLDPGLPAGMTQMWSLAVEGTFYLLLPLLMLLAVPRGRAPRPARVLLVLGAMTLTTVVWQLQVLPRLEGGTSAAPGQWLPGFAVWFAVGIGLAYVDVLHEHGSAGLSARVTAALVALGRQPGACWGAALGLLLICATPLAGPVLFVTASPAQGLLKHLAYAVVGGLLLLSCVYAPPGRFRRAFSAPAARHLGLISYGVFCLHLPVLHLVMWTTGWPLFEGRTWQIWLLTLVVSLVAAELGYRLVEVPAMRLRDLGRAPVASAVPTASSTGTSASHAGHAQSPAQPAKSPHGRSR